MDKHQKFKRSQWLALIPDMLTMFNLFCGFFSILASWRGDFIQAAWFIVFSLVFDSLDGNVARIFNTSGSLGRELDSLSDMVSFIVAPAFFMAVFIFNEPYLQMIVLVYLSAGAFRLARFNIGPGTRDRFQGLPTPAAAVFLIMLGAASLKGAWADADAFKYFAILILVGISFLMVSKFPYPKLSAIHFRRWRWQFILAVLLCLSFSVLVNFEMGMASIFGFFIFLSPLYYLSAHSVPQTIP